MTIDKDDFELWRGHPVTEAVFRAFDILAERAKEKWLDISWRGGSTDPLMLADLRARAEVIQDFRELTLEDLEEWLNEQSKRNLPD